MRHGKFTVNEVEERTKVPASTLRQWERRYGFPKPERSGAGYRLYSELDLGHIDAMKRHIAQGIPASRAAELVRARSPRAEAPRSLELLQEELSSAFITLDEAGAQKVLSEAYSLHTVEVVVQQLIAGCARRLGEMWEQGTLEGSAVSAACSVLTDGLRAQLTAHSVPGRVRPVLVAAGPGEQHQLASLLLTLMLRRSGFRAHHLGNLVGIDTIASLAGRLEASALLLSVATKESLDLLKRGHDDLAQAAPLIGLGGAALDAAPQKATECGGIYLGATIGEGIDRLRRELHFREVG